METISDSNDIMFDVENNRYICYFIILNTIINFEYKEIISS